MVTIPRIIHDQLNGLVVLFTSTLWGDSLTNSKTKPMRSSIPFVNMVIHDDRALSLGDKVTKGKGSRAKIMHKACDLNCRFIAKELGGSGLCNQSRPLNHYANKIKRVNEAPQLYPALELDKFQLRATVWGDLSRLSPHVLAQILPIIEGASLRLGYVSGWRTPQMESFKGLLQASVGDTDEAIEAHNLGWAPYGTFDRAEFRASTGKPAYKCPYGPETLKGCADCEIRCDGNRAVTLRAKA